VLFVPTLGGGTSFEGGPEVRGGFVGLGLQHGRAEIMRATFEGIALALRVALDELRRMRPLRNEMVMVGGGARSAAWRQMFADIFDCTVLKTTIDQQAAALGAAALAFVGTGAWADFSPMRALTARTERTAPDPASVPVYEAALKAYRVAARQQRELSETIPALRDLSV
jgi:xylulokinase